MNLMHPCPDHSKPLPIGATCNPAELSLGDLDDVSGGCANSVVRKSHLINAAEDYGCEAVNRI